MDDGIYKASGSMMLEARRQEAIARNLAGATMPGFKRDFVVNEEFQSTYYQEAGSTLTGTMFGADSGKNFVDFSAGTLKQTDRRLDFAFDSLNKKSSDETVRNSELFFNAQTPDGKTVLTKCGAFFLDSQMRLVTADGYPILSAEGAEITLGTDDNIDCLCVTSDGVLKLDDRTTSPSTLKTIGTIKLSMVEKPQNLTRYSANYFADSNNSAKVSDALPEHFCMMNGYYEDSNSSPIQEMTAMIRSYREYEINSKLITTLNDRYSKEFNKLG